MKINLECTHCKNHFTRIVYPSTKIGKKVYCSVECKRRDKTSFVSEWSPERRESFSVKMSGSNNPNFGNKWDDEQKSAASASKKQQFLDKPEYAKAVGSANRGKTFSPEKVSAMHSGRDRASYSHPHTPETKALIGAKSSAKWTSDFKDAFYQTMVKLGHWTPRESQNPYKIYYKASNWVCSMVEFFSTEEREMLLVHGFYNKTNTVGFVRDHIVPRKTGFEFGIPPELLRHPANLQFISHAQNISKGFRDRRLTAVEKRATINLLIQRIESFSQPWHEQTQCLTLIQERRLSDA